MGAFSGTAIHATRSTTQPSPRMSVDARPSTIFDERAFYLGGRFVTLLQMFGIVALPKSWLLKERKCLSSHSVRLAWIEQERKRQDEMLSVSAAGR